MRGHLPLLVCALVVSLVSAGSAAAGTIPGQYIVVLESDADSGAIAKAHARSANADVSHVYRRALNGYAARLSAAGLKAVRSDPRVAFVSEDRAVRATAQGLPTGVNRVEGDVSSTQAGNGGGTVSVAAAVIDTGIDVDHPDLNVVGGRNCSTGRSYDDGNGHGTHVAGTMAAKDNAAGVVGLAPGAPLYAVRVLNNNGSGSWSSVVCGIDWVTANAASKGIKVANMSLGGSGSDDGNCGRTNNDALHTAICNSVRAGVTYVVAAGNDNSNLGGFVPAAYNEVLTVTAVADFNGQPGGGAGWTCRADVDDTAADFSNWTTIGSADVGHTIAAPGVCIDSTWKGGGYNAISGTSMASPHVAGTAQLCIAGPCAGMTPSQVMTRLRSDAASRTASYGFRDDPNTPNGSRYYGYLEYAGGY
ncbi:MAG TPA: S8 family serine peptidase [Gaiellaceae bacterium]|nr:S8 family serine peptidase [Gaiellaceae bacterium]